MAVYGVVGDGCGGGCVLIGSKHVDMLLSLLVEYYCISCSCLKNSTSPERSHTVSMASMSSEAPRHPRSCSNQPSTNNVYSCHPESVPNWENSFVIQLLPSP